jgi:hypothetical protein
LNDHKDETEEGTVVTPPDPPPLGSGDAHAEFVLNDVVVPFFSPWVVPIPRHVTVGMRRRVLNLGDATQSHRFDTAPIRISLSAEPLTGIIVDSFFFKSLPGGAGVTFDMAFVLGSTHNDAGKSEAVAIGIALEEGYAIVASYRRDIDAATGLPVIRPNTGSGTVDDILETVNRLLHLEIATITLDALNLRFGVSLGRLIGEGESFGNSFEITSDLFLHMPASGNKTVGLRSLNGEPVKVIAEAVGWKYGSLSLEGMALPDGVVFFIGPFGLVIQEVGLTAEDGATYVMISGGIDIAPPSGWEVVFLLKRLRIFCHGPDSAPRLKLDGFYLAIRTDVFTIEVAGYYSVTRTPELTREEVGLTGSLYFEVSGIEWGLSIDFLRGRVTTPSDEFTYWFAQVALRGSIPIYAVLLKGLRALYANNMKPRLTPVDRESRDLRYFRWYRENDPLTVPGDRRLAAWESRNDSMAFGLGCTIAFTAAPTLHLTAFVLWVSGPDEKGLLIVVEARLGKNPNPLGYLAIEIDIRHDRWSGVLGVALRIENFIESAPKWLSDMGELSGTIFIGNDPPTFAIGRLNDQRTWLGLRWDFDVWGAVIKADFIACIEYVENGPKGFGLAIRFTGGFNVWVIKATYTAGFGVAVAVFTTPSSDYAAAIWIEFAFRIVLFGFLKFGVSIGAAFRTVGARPSRGELRLEIRFETPWFLPDITWTWETTFGSLAPADLATSTTPLEIAAAGAGAQQGLSVHVERFDASFDADQPLRPYSINELRAGAASEATRLARFAANPDVQPLATDATISIDWSLPVEDRLALGNGMATGLGEQSSGDLDLSYELIGLAIRRRARFGSDTSWHEVDERLELPPDFSDPDGVQLTGSFGPQVISAQWDTDVRVEGEPAPKRLLINASTPFEYVTANPEADEELIKNNPSWPCCERKKKRSFRVYSLRFVDELVGTEIVGARQYRDCGSTFRFSQSAIAAPNIITTSLPTGTTVARLVAPDPGLVARVVLDQDVAYWGLRLAWRPAAGALVVRAYDADGAVVGTRTVPLFAGSDLTTIPLGGSAPIRTVEVRYVSGAAASAAGAPLMSTHAVSAASRVSVLPGALVLEIEGSMYVTLRDYLDWGSDQDCADPGAGSGGGYEGRGKVFFLPNHEYEVAVTTRVTIDHPSTSPEAAEVSEYVYFATKGLPGLNAVDRIGAEVEPYVRGAYAGGRGLLYREEPIVLAFDEDFLVALPLSLRPPGSADEHVQLQRMQLVVRPEVAPTASTPFTTTSEDWIVANRTGPSIIVGVWQPFVTAGTTLGTRFRSTDRHRVRLAGLTQRSPTCDLEDPLDVSGALLVAPPQGVADPENPGEELWPASTAHAASVRLEAAPYTHRTVFAPADLTALDVSTESGASAGAWSVTDGALVAPGGNARRYAAFGEANWNHVKVSVLVTVAGTSAGSMAGVALALPGSGAPSRALLAYVEKVSGGHRLVLARRTGAAPEELAGVELPAPADPGAPLSLHVWGYDDVVRASIGKAVVEAARGSLREGRVGLVSRRGASFKELDVTGIEVFRFPVTTSRYRSFHQHVRSWSGQTHRILPDEMGPGTSTEDPASLWASTSGQVQSVMQPAASDEDRDAVFSQWVSGLGLPLRQDAKRLEVSSYDVAGRTRALLIETPEPIDFVEEVTVRLERRVVTRPPRPGLDLSDLLGALRETRRERSGTLPTGPSLAGARIDIASELVRAFEEEGQPRDPQAPDADPPADRFADDRGAIVSVHRRGQGIDISVEVADSTRDLRGGRVVLFERIDTADERQRLRVYRGVVDDRRGELLHIRADETETTTVVDPGRSALTTGFRGELERGEIVGVVLDPAGGLTLGGFTVTWEDVDVDVVQGAGGKSSILVPVSVGGATELTPGTYRLTLDMDRARWQTVEPADDLNRYRDSAQLSLTL